MGSFKMLCVPLCRLSAGGMALPAPDEPKTAVTFYAQQAFIRSRVTHQTSPGIFCNFMEPKRLNKFISDAGFCSRREADQLIAQERVTVNGKLPEPGAKVSAKDKVRIDG
jgi:hypothetical protein